MSLSALSLVFAALAGIVLTAGLLSTRGSRPAIGISLGLFVVSLVLVLVAAL